MRRVWCCSYTVVFVTICSARALEKNPMNGSQITVPKCCERNETYNLFDGTCSQSDESVNYDHYYFDSNETHISSYRVPFTPKFYKRSLNCSSGYDKSPYYGAEMLGFISNSSVIKNVTNQHTSEAIISPLEYCVFEILDSIAFLQCEKFISENKVIAVYFPFLIISTLCYFSSAFIYCFVLKVKQVQKKCFIGYAFSMGVTFSFLAILQKVEATGVCDTIGSFFFFSILSSFVWLACLCLELILMVRNFKEDTDENRISIYLATSLAFPCFLLLLNLIPHGKPDVPDSFMKPNGRSICKFEGTSMLYFFIAIGIMMVSSLIFLGYNFYLMGRMGTKYRNHFNWLENRSKFKYMSISCSLIWLTSAVWIVDTAIRNMNTVIGNPDVFDVIEAIQGIFAMAIFVTDRYTRREIFERFGAASDINPERRRHIGTIRWISKKLSLRSKMSTENAGEEGVRIE